MIFPFGNPHLFMRPFPAKTCTCPAIYRHPHTPIGREWLAKQAICNLYHKLVHGEKYA